MNSVRVGIIGAGKMGILHSCLYNKLKRSELVAICDNTPINLKLLRSIIPKVQLYDDYYQMIEEAELDLVVITTPVFLHNRMSKDALKKGAGVFVEKPLALNADESQDLVNSSGKATTYVGYCRRFMGTYNKAKHLIDSGEYGAVKSFSSHMFSTQIGCLRSGWQYDAKRSGGGVVMDLGSHAVDMVNYLMGNVKEVSAISDCDINTIVEDHAKIAFRLTSDVEGTMDVSWAQIGYRLPELMLDIELEKGRIRVCEKNLEILHQEGSSWSSVQKIYKQSLEEGVQIDIGGQEYTREDEHLIDAIIDRTDTRCNFREGAKANYIVEAVYKSMKDGGQWKSPRWDQ
jgi:predicted dehydrogenase